MTELELLVIAIPGYPSVIGVLATGEGCRDANNRTLGWIGFDVGIGYVWEFHEVVFGLHVITQGLVLTNQSHHMNRIG